MKIVVLAENTSKHDDLYCEHGLSIYIEMNDHKILFDMGQTSLFAENAAKMSIDLSEIDIAVISHGHYDHGGGLEAFLELNTKAPIYINRHAFEPHYNADNKYIGLDTSTQYNDRIVFIDDVLEIDKKLTLCSCNDMERNYESSAFGLSVMTDGIHKPDDFRHEQYLLIQEKGKQILISSCSHKGILNITHHFKPDILIGGFHFIKLKPDSEYLTDAANTLLSYPTQFYTCHCTGTAQYNQLKTIMCEKLSYLSTGDVLEL